MEAPNHGWLCARRVQMTYIVSEEGFILTGDGWLRAHARSCIWCIRTAKKVKENNLLELEYRFFEKNECTLLQMKHLAEWKHMKGTMH